MRESNFIDQNRTKWEELEGVLEKTKKDPEQLNDLFVQVTDDLSFSRTFYPNRSVRVYLNGLAQRIFLSIYKNRKSQSRRLITFWTDELPQLVYESRRAFRLSFAVFLLAFCIGMLSSAMDPEFVNVVLGEDYVRMTEENIRSGDPLKVYKQRGEFGMTLGITVNNIYVSFLTFVLGVFFSVGSIAFLLFNGVMLGAFQYFFIERGLFWESFLTVWMHGTLEISAIIIAGAAGITMGQGLLFPGTYTRMQAFQQSARRGIKIMVGIVPIFMIAGFIEGYVTRHTELPSVFRGAFIGLCLLFVLFYFVWYPFRLSRLGFSAQLREARIPPDESLKIDFSTIKSSGDILADALLLLKKHFGRISAAAAIGAAAYAAIVFLIADRPPLELFAFPGNRLTDIFGDLSQLFSKSNTPWAPWAAIVAMSCTAMVVFSAMRKETKGQRLQGFHKGAQVLYAVMGATALEMVLFTNNSLTIFILAATYPFVLLWMYINYSEKVFPLKGIRRTLFLLQGNYFKGLGLLLLGLVLGLILLALLNTGLSQFFFSLLSWLIRAEEGTLEGIGVIFLVFIYIFLTMWVMALLLMGASIQYYTFREIREAPTLQARIQKIGLVSRIRGMERETYD